MATWLNKRMESVYVGTSVVSYLVARPPARTVAYQWHVWTKDWWRLRRPYFECVISAEVLREARLTANQNPRDPSGRMNHLGVSPRVACSSQPWAKIRSAFSAAEARPAIDSWEFVGIRVRIFVSPRLGEFALKLLVPTMQD